MSFSGSFRGACHGVCGRGEMREAFQQSLILVIKNIALECMIAQTVPIGMSFTRNGDSKISPMGGEAAAAAGNCFSTSHGTANFGQL